MELQRERHLFHGLLSKSRPLLLMVDDDKPLSDVICAILNYMDYKAIQVSDLEQAIALHQRNSQAHIILANIALTGEYPCAIFDHLFTDFVGVATVLCSGNPKVRSALLWDTPPYPITFLSKPFDVLQFAYAIRHAMDVVYETDFSDRKKPALPVSERMCSFHSSKRRLTSAS